MVESLKVVQFLKKRLCVSNKAQFSGTISESCAWHFNISYTLFGK